MADKDDDTIMEEISKNLARSQRHLKSIADCMRVLVAALMVVLFFAYLFLSSGSGPLRRSVVLEPEHIAVPASVVVNPAKIAAPAPVAATAPATATTPAAATAAMPKP